VWHPLSGIPKISCKLNNAPSTHNMVLRLLTDGTLYSLEAFDVLFELCVTVSGTGRGTETIAKSIEESEEGKAGGERDRASGAVR